ncbi:MAG: lysophospholipid acyltransferase family protein [Spirochaetota bacterium]
MNFVNALLVLLVRIAGSFLVRLDSRQLARLPKRGPCILAMNHVNFLDGPLLLSRLFPRRVASLAKKETWKNPIVGFLASAIGAIPLDRGFSDPAALRKAAAVLDGGGFLYINPEGTRSRDGVLRKGKAGVVSIALATGSPVVPVAFEGLEDFSSNFRRLRRTKAIIHVGEPFVLLPPPEGSQREARAEALEEIMQKIAALLPEAKRGEFGSRKPELAKHTRTVSF